MKLMFIKKAHGVIVEYPSYGVYNNYEPSEKRIYDDSLTIFDYFTNDLNFD